MSNNKTKLGDAIFADIENNKYLGELYAKLLENYGYKTFYLSQNIQPFSDKEKNDILRFADLLSKSNHPNNSDKHKIWAQEIVVLMGELYKDDPAVKLYAGNVFSSVGNHKGVEYVNPSYTEVSVLEQIFAEYRNDYLRIPAKPGEKFFSEQKKVYDRLKDDFFSFSTPTSMGKSFLMRMFIKDEIMQDAVKNYALIVPNKVLINEVRAKIITDLGGDNNTERVNYLKEHNYNVITSANDIALEDTHNFIFVMTPERFLHLMIAKPDLKIDYLFIDNAHKLSEKNSQAPYYYKVVDMLQNQKPQPRFVFASPNIPNPEVYLKMITQAETGKDNALSISYSPVTQFKFIMDFKNGIIDIYNERAKNDDKRIPIKSNTVKDVEFNDFLYEFESMNNASPKEKRKQSIIYYNGREKAINAARLFFDSIKSQIIENDPLLEALSRDIKNEVHDEYYLADMVQKGIAYYIEYLPASIRTRIEELFIAGNIKVVFCTSALLEGVNLPADNLFIMDDKIARSKMRQVEFRNLVGRIGRINFNLYGNVFFVAENNGKVTTEDYIQMLQDKIPEQTLSITTNTDVLKKADKKYIAEILKAGKSEIPKRISESGKTKQSEEAYIMMRKFALILQRDIVNDRDSLVRREFKKFLTPEDEKTIREAFKEEIIKSDDYINISVDQTKRLIAAITRQDNPLRYPNLVDGKFVYQDVLGFLDELNDVFRWDIYESSTLGDPEHRRLYASILCLWMGGSELKHIMDRGLDHYNVNSFAYSNNTYGADITHNINFKERHDIIFSNTLKIIEDIILFSISNYFLCFSNEYRKINGDAELNKNNWYEYVEYGTTNPLTILLQRNGFTRESARYIKERPEYAEKDSSDGVLKLKSSLSSCGNKNVENEVKYIKQNVPNIFIDSV